MKNLLFLLTTGCILLHPIQVFSQTQQAINSNVNYSSFYDFMDQYFNNPSYQPSNNEGGTDEYIKKTFKLWGNSLHPTGDFSIAASAITSYANGYSFIASSYNPNWVSLGPFEDPNTPFGNSSGVGQIHRVEYDPNYDGSSNQIIYAGTGFGGLWKTIDNGLNWTSMNTDVQLPVASVSGIAINPSNSSNIFISTGDGDGGLGLHFTNNHAYPNPVSTVGVYRTTDNGQNWESINNGLLSNFSLSGIIRELRMNPSNPDEIILASSAGIIKTTNATSATPNWTVEFTGVGANVDQQFRGIEYKPGDPTTIYASGTDIYKFDGTNWSSMTGIGTGLDFSNFPNSYTPVRINIAVTPADPNMLYAYIYGTETGNNKKVYVYVFKNNSWAKIYEAYGSGTNNISLSWLPIAVSPVNANEYYFGFTKVYGTSDYTSNPVQNVSNYNTSGFHADVHALRFAPNMANPDLFAGTHGGVNYLPVPSDPNPIWRWQRRYKGLAVSLIWSFDNSEFDARKIIGKQDLGISVFKPTTNTWYTITGGDGYATRIDDEYPDEVYFNGNFTFKKYNFYLGGIYQTEFNKLPTDYFEQNQTIVHQKFPMVNHPQTGELWFGFSELYKRKKREIVSGDSNSDIWQVESDAYKFPNHNAQWQRAISEIVIAESNPNYIYIATTGVDNGSIGSTWQLNPLLMRSTIGGCNGNPTANCFTDITSNLPNIYGGATDYPVITGIAVNPSDENELWVTFAGYDPTLKVWHSIDAGNTWTNYDSSVDLPNLSVNSIVYQDGTNDILYVGTDVGVYVKEGQSASWKKYGDFPNVRVTKVRVNNCAGKLDVATYGRGLWEGDLLPSGTFSGGRIITGTETWGGEKSMRSNLIIPNGSVLTITGTVNMPKDGKILVEQGGKLIVDGGTITNHCGQLWKGIEVEGDVNTRQLDASLKHGRLDVLNGSLIENARFAVRLHKNFDSGSNDHSTAGGIIVANNSTFKNNIKDIEFLAYQNFALVPNPPSSVTLVSDISSIQKCNFIWDDTGNMFSLGMDIVSRDHISMHAVHGVKIQGNQFRNDFPSTNTTNYKQGNGIFSIDADYTVNEFCNSPTFPCLNSTPNLFQNLRAGVSVMGLNTTARVIVDGNIFDENRFSGVELLASTYTTVTRNKFNLPVSTIVLADGGEAIGIYSIGSFGFNFEENSFITTGSGPATGSNYGIVADNSSLNGGLIYKNEYKDVIVGNLSSQDNTLLSIDCNTHVSGSYQRYDLAITSGDLDDQGDCASFPANNSFSSSCAGDENIFHYLNNPASLIYFALIGTDPSCVTFPEVFVVPCAPTDPNNACPSNIINPMNPTAILLTINTIRAEIAALNLQFDGGDQNNLISIIYNQPNGQVKNELILASPYLSDKVLISFLGKPNPLPSGHVKQIITANSPVTSKVQDEIDNISLPKGIRNQINLVQTGISERRLLENQISQLETRVQLLKNDLIRQCLDNHLIGDIKNLLNTDRTTSDKAALLPLIVETDLVEANQLITELRVDASDLRIDNPDSDKADDIDKFCDFFTCVKDRITSCGDINAFTSVDEQIMRTLAATDAPIAIKAQNALSFYKGETVQRHAEPIINISSSSRIGNTETSIQNYVSYSYELNNYPNPFNENTVIEVTIPENTKGELLITDITGKQIKRIDISQTESRIELNGNEFGYGLFFYSLYINNEFVQTNKMTRMR